MSKIQSNIERAIEKSKSSRVESAGRGIAESPLVDRGRKKIAEAFRVFQSVISNPQVMEDSKILVESGDRSAKSAYDLLRTRVAQRLRSNGWRTFLVTSPGAGEGKSLTASNLAMSLSRDETQSVVLVDLDLQRSSVARYFGFSTEIKAGIGDYLNGKAELADIIYVPNESQRLAIIPNREQVPNSSDLLGGSKMEELLSWLSSEFGQSLVIFDMPPILACDDVLVFRPHVDAVLLVVAQGQTDRAALPKAMELLEDANLLGIVLNKSSEVDSESAYGY